MRLQNLSDGDSTCGQDADGFIWCWDFGSVAFDDVRIGNAPIEECAWIPDPVLLARAAPGASVRLVAATIGRLLHVLEPNGRFRIWRGGDNLDPSERTVDSCASWRLAADVRGVASFAATKDFSVYRDGGGDVWILGEFCGDYLHPPGRKLKWKIAGENAEEEIERVEISRGVDR